MKRALVILFVALTVLPAAAQEPRIQHRPYLDNRRLHYGFFIGLNMMDMEVTNNGYIDPATGQFDKEMVEKFDGSSTSKSAAGIPPRISSPPTSPCRSR